MHDKMHFMKVSAPSLLPMLRSDKQGRILAAIFLAGEHSIGEIAAAADTDSSSVVREVDRLEEAGFVTSRRRGRLRLVGVVDNEVTDALRTLMMRTYGPVPLLRATLDGHPEIVQAFVFGSYARRYVGERGPIPQDIDVLVIAERARAYHEAADDLERLGHDLRLRINVHRATPEHWNDGIGGFVVTIKDSPLITLKET